MSRGPAVHLVRGGLFPHAVQVDGEAKVPKTEVLADVTCGLCLGAAGEFLKDGAA